MQNIRTVEQLLELSDMPLVEALYARLLRRKPDAEELEFYVGQLRSGYGKNELIVDFASLPEVTAKGLALSGLQQYLARQRRRRTSIGQLFRRGRQHENQLNRLENTLGRLLQELHGMRQEMQQRLASIESQLNLTATAAAPPAAVAPAAQPDEVDLSGVSVAVRRIFREVSQQVESANTKDAV